MSVLVRKLLCSLFVLVAALVAATSASAAQVKLPPPGDPSYVRIVPCILYHGGAMTVPANTPLTVADGYADPTPQAVMSEVTGTNVLTVNGQAVNLHQYWAGPVQSTDPLNPYWVDFFFAPIGEVAVGQSAALTWNQITCTITGA